MRYTHCTWPVSASCPKHFILIVRLPLTTMLLTSSPLSLILTLTLVRPASFLFPLWGAYRDCFHVFLSLCVFSSGFTRGGIVTHNPILLFHTISARPPKQPRMVRTFLKVHTRPRLAYALRCRGYGIKYHLTTSSLFATRTCVFCNQLAYGIVVIRRAVEMATLGS
jgi:hypothetical protein